MKEASLSTMGQLNDNWDSIPIGDICRIKSTRLLRVIISLLDCPSVSRLKNIRQLGFADQTFANATESRFDHTIKTIRSAIRILEQIHNIPEDVMGHIVAAVALTEVGHGPFSSALDYAFDGIEGVEYLIYPPDVARSLAIAKYIEESSGLFKTNGLNLAFVLKLMCGQNPWPGRAYAKVVMDSAFDADRLSYVESDAFVTAHECPCVASLARGIQWESGAEVTCIDPAAEDIAAEFIFARARLYMDVYYEKANIACGFLVRQLLNDVWIEAEKVPEWESIRKPRTIAQFIGWTDSTLIAFVADEVLWSAAKEELKLFREKLVNSYFQVAEVMHKTGGCVSFQDLDNRIDQINDEFCAPFVWFLKSEQLPYFSIFTPESIWVHGRGGFKAIENVSKWFSSMRERGPYLRRPVVIFAYEYFKKLQELFSSHGLEMGRVSEIENPFRGRK